MKIEESNIVETSDYRVIIYPASRPFAPKESKIITEKLYDFLRNKEILDFPENYSKKMIKNTYLFKAFEKMDSLSECVYHIFEELKILISPDILIFFLEEEKKTAAFILIQQEISEIKEQIENIEKIKKELKDFEELNKIADADESIKSELGQKYRIIEKHIEKEETKMFLSGKYDRNNAIMEIFSGAGGQDSQDWATMLLRMYEKYCAARGFSFNVLHQAFGEGGGPEGRIGTKSATIEIKGNYAYGFLKKESGVHRLVRISPFNAQKLRHTSFAMVNVLPEIKEEDEELEIKQEDLKRCAQ